MRSWTVFVRSICGIAALAVSPTAAAAAPHQPQEPWRVDYDEEQCIATRQYGSEEKPLIFALKPSPFGGVMRILIIRKGSAGAAQHSGILRYDDGPAQDIALLSYGDRKSRHRVVAINVPMDTFKSQLHSDSIAVRSTVYSGSFEVNGLAAVVAELDKCLLDLQDYWNVRQPNSLRVVQPAEPEQPLGSYFQPSDYPAPAVHLRQTGGVGASFLIDEDGGIADCSVEQTSGSAALDTMTCYVIRARAKFAPALGADGKPMKSFLTTQVKWVMR